MKREFTRICCMQLKLLNVTKYNVVYENNNGPSTKFCEI